MKIFGSKFCELEDMINELGFSDRRKTTNIGICIALMAVGGTQFSTS